ncbi:MAG: hypothetical protein H6779_03140 [Candidatus Nomurabacteria bacterium]|nr:MAG: hypothetical protein H6779_03140 [Candidatus Nomurabacteria bacterium]
MERSIKEQLDQQGEKIEAIYESVEKTRKYFLITMWTTIAVVVLPMIGLAFVIPAFINTYMVSFGGLI